MSNRMSNLRDENSEMPDNFNEFINLWSLESVSSIALDRRLNILSGKSKDEKAAELIKLIRAFFVQGYAFSPNQPSIWKFYETKAFKELIKVYDGITKYVKINESNKVEFNFFFCKVSSCIMSTKRLQKWKVPKSAMKIEKTVF